MLSQYRLRGVEIGAIGKRRRQAPIVDLGDIDGRVSGRP
jgi:hypothetical protein